MIPLNISTWLPPRSRAELADLRRKKRDLDAVVARLTSEAASERETIASALLDAQRAGASLRAVGSLAAPDDAWCAGGEESGAATSSVVVRRALRRECCARMSSFYFFLRFTRAASAHARLTRVLTSPSPSLSRSFALPPPPPPLPAPFR